MVKVIVFQPRPETMTREDFHRHLHEVHLPLVAKMPRLRRLVMNWVVTDPGDPPPAYEGVAEAWYDSASDLEAAYASAQGQAVIADGPNYLDMGRFHWFLVDEEDVPLPSSSGGGSTEVGSARPRHS